MSVYQICWYLGICELRTMQLMHGYLWTCMPMHRCKKQQAVFMLCLCMPLLDQRFISALAPITMNTAMSKYQLVNTFYMLVLCLLQEVGMHELHGSQYSVFGIKFVGVGESIHGFIGGVERPSYPKH